MLLLLDLVLLEVLIRQLTLVFVADEGQRALVLHIELKAVSQSGRLGVTRSASACLSVTTRGQRVDSTDP